MIPRINWNKREGINMSDNQTQDDEQKPSPLEKMSAIFDNVDGATPKNEGIHLQNTFQYAASGVPDYILQAYDATEEQVTQAITQRIEDLGLSSQIVLKDGTIQDYEFAQAISKGGYIMLDDANICIEDITEENYPEAFKKAHEFAVENNLSLEGHEDIALGLVAFEILAHDEMSHIIESSLEKSSVRNVAAEIGLISKLGGGY